MSEKTNSEIITNDSLRKLAEPFSTKRIAWRVGSTSKDKKKGQALPYIDARCVQDRFDEVVGPANWTVQFHPSPVGNGMVARIGVKVNGEWVYKEDGAQLDTVKNDDSRANASEIAVKGAYSDAIKRAAVMWGVGRYLYDYEPQWVEIDEYKKMKTIPRLPAHMLPANEAGQAANRSAQAPQQQAQQSAQTKPALVQNKSESSTEKESASQNSPSSGTNTAAANIPAANNSDNFPEGLNETQAGKINEMVGKIGVADSETMRVYLNSENAKKLYPAHALQYVLDKLKAYEDSQKKAA